MSFEKYTSTIQDGNIAIVYHRHSDIYPLVITAGNYVNNKDGSYKHDDFIGKPWGSKVCLI
jgi:tRNA (adenine57-N1/adenine58-N1)-methyltransferase